LPRHPCRKTKLPTRFHHSYSRTAQLLGKVIVLVRLKTEKMNDHTLKDWSDGGIKDKLRFRDLDDLVNEMIVGGSSIDVEKWKADILKMLWYVIFYFFDILYKYEYEYKY
jgi:hypothetical protein